MLSGIFFKKLKSKPKLHVRQRQMECTQCNKIHVLGSMLSAVQNVDKSAASQFKMLNVLEEEHCAAWTPRPLYIFIYIDRGF